MTSTQLSPPATIAVSGASGMVGQELCRRLRESGFGVRRMVRTSAQGEEDIFWSPQEGTLDKESLQGVEGVIHLAGENIAAGRWTQEKKRRIRESRVVGTELIARSLADLETPPQVLLSASAIGYYGDRGAEELDESAAPGEGYLPEVCQAWEEATAPAAEAGIRVANLRLGLVLSQEGGALAKMLTPFKLGIGGRIGSGKQFMSWITRGDAVAAMLFALENPSIAGPVNLVAPESVTNREFTKTLGKVLRRPTVFPVPAAGARLAFGEMADALLLASARVVPARLTDSGYQFAHGELEAALRAVLDRESPSS